VVGKFAPLHRGHQLLLDAARDLASSLTVIVWSTPDFPAMPNDVRAGWVRELYPGARVIVGNGGPDNAAPDLEQREYVVRLLRAADLAPDVVVTGVEDYGPGFAAHLGVAHVTVDRPRTTVPLSGTAVRGDVHAYREFLDPRVYRHFVTRVVFLGAESTGKTTLAERMAAELGTVWMPEYGRDYYAERGGVLDLEDYVTIARRHREGEDDLSLQANRYLFVDTNAITTMFFSHYYNRGSLPALRRMADECAARYQRVVVCDDDIPFEQDGWRDNVVWRGRMQGMVLHDLDVRGIPYAIVRGSLDERVEQVTSLLDAERYFQSPWRTNPAQ
jgi:NadR type nicotinamide-nucleotide adenylyltransferase